MRTQTKAYIFAMCAILFLVVMIIMIVLSAGPLVLGTELNANGTMEYLCLFRGCENL